ncbi:TonB-dependent siderophore receptor [Marinobacter sp. JSM 1782161]|uniref:TonB-dependent siderophore receptor n=1 Tax=Marinobacter sp. JSM 1782161 TaxID=2685906 RepID=UPI0014028D29|nr:TonB-dependent siderophore receptor [Marinobacter sp. JSM 1782161]
MLPAKAPTSRLAHAIRCFLPLTLILTSPLALAQSNDDSESLSLGELVVTDTALKVEAPLVETPRPASVVEREELDERNVQSLDETFRYRAGVVSGMYGADNDTDWFKVRGYDQSTYQDGLRIYREGFYQWLPETYGLERVELLKGPASILYGEAPPGGVINAISKRPTEETQGEVMVQGGTNNHQQYSFDTSGPVSGRDDVRYRLVGLYRNADGDIDYTNNERFYIAPSVEWDITDDTQLTVLASFQKDNAIPYNGFKLAYGTLDDTPFGKVDPSVNYGEPDYDTNEREQSSIGYQLSHRFNDTWTFEQDLRYSHLDLLLRSTYIFFQSGPREGTRGLTYRDGSIESWTMDNRMVGKWFTDRTENTLLLGVDYQDLKNSGQEADPFPFGTIDLFDPVYGNFTPVADADLTSRKITKEQTGLYIQDQLRLDDRWIFLAGLRYDSAETDNTNRSAGTTESADDDQVSFSGGVMYLADNGLSPYISYAESFQPLVGTDSNGDLYDPLEGKQLEAGVKYAPDFLDGYVTASVYRIEEKNSLVTAGQVQAQEGERNTDGFELEGVAYLTDNLQLTAAYTYSDSNTENTATDEGEVQAALIPRHMASAWLDYAFADTVPGLKVGGGARYVGETKDKTYGYDVPSYTVFDLMAQYDFAQHWRVQVNANNVFDREYVASCDYWCYYGEQRSVIGSVSYRW